MEKTFISSERPEEFCQYISYLYRFSVISFNKILLMAGRETRKAQKQILELFSEKKENLVIL